VAIVVSEKYQELLVPARVGTGAARKITRDGGFDVGVAGADRVIE